MHQKKGDIYRIGVNKDAYQRETLAKWPVQLPLKAYKTFEIQKPFTK